MKILISAYACEPNKGSEPGVGWGWATELARHHQVWVVTRDNNRPVIEAYLESNPEFRNENLKFIYVGLPKILTFWKKGNRGIRLYYTLWQRKAANIAAEWNKKIQFDLVHHVTFVSYTQVTYMYKLNIPMIWGPVSGGENIPSGIKIEMSAKEKLKETVRKMSQQMALMMPSIRKTMKAAKHILAATEETKEKLPRKYQGKTRIIPAIGLEKMSEEVSGKKNSDTVRIIMAGRLIYWKAFDIGLMAFLQIADRFPHAELHILGEGNKKDELKKLAGSYLGKQVFFEPPVSHDQIFEFYSGYDIFLNTTLRDSGCMTMMEAMSVGLPCIAIATGGPKVLLEGSPCGQIGTESYESCVKAISRKLSEVIENESFRHNLAGEQYSYAKQHFLISNKVKCLEEMYRI